jgi:hypothetical protein
MKSGTALAATFFALASFPLLAQQPSPATQPASPANNPQQNPPAAQPAPPSSPAAQAVAPQAPMSPVNGQLESKLDSKTAKTGDNVVVKTQTAIKTSDGTEIPKGSKLIGHIIAVQPSASGTNSQVALQFDHIELKGGQSLPVHSQIQSISPAGAAAASADSSTGAPAPAAAPAAGSSNRSMGTNSASTAQRTPGTPETTNPDSGTAAAAANSMPAPGTVVAKNGNIAIQTTSIPGLLLANNAPGLQDPRMATASSILLGARKDVQLDGGTQMVVGISAGQ